MLDSSEGSWMDGHRSVVSLPDPTDGSRELCPLGQHCLGCEAVTWTHLQSSEQSLGCLCRPPHPINQVYLCNTSGLMETRCDQMVVWAALGCWNAKPDTFYGCWYSAISLEVLGLSPDTHSQMSLFCKMEASSIPCFICYACEKSTFM